VYLLKIILHSALPQFFFFMKKTIFFFFACLYCSLNAQGTSTTASNTNEFFLTAETAPIELQHFASNDLFWAYNTLMSVEDNALLLAKNDDETRLLRSVQKAKSIKPNVQIVSSNNEAMLFKQLKINNLDQLLQREQATFLTLTVADQLKEKVKPKSYLTGLALKMTAMSFDNVAMLKANIEQKFLLDYLAISFIPDEKKTAMYSASTYFAPLSVLYRYYKSINDEVQSENIKALLHKIAQQTDNETYLSTILDESLGKSPIAPSLIQPKALEKDLVKISSTLYANATEISNQQYNLFLQDLLQQREYDKILLYKINPTDWQNFMTEEQKKLDEKTIFPWGRPESDRFPVQNISYEAAVFYCDWITAAYNKNPSPKKKYKKVIFRLPSEQEWETAARGAANMNAVYGWSTVEHGDGYKNPKGCFLSNFGLNDPRYECLDCKSKFKESSRDGAYFTVFTESYFPNTIGLYNTAGNVAEMVAEKGKAKGGSWEDIPENCTIKSVKSYEKPSPAIGFRVFMEIVE
jgi:formylglycine-generating enzyme required for sulfatase activity